MTCLPSSTDNKMLGVVDDKPREEFTPRQRHTLKEFAVRKGGLHVLFLSSAKIFLGHCHEGDGALEG